MPIFTNQDELHEVNNKDNDDIYIILILNKIKC